MTKCKTKKKYVFLGIHVKVHLLQLLLWTQVVCVSTLLFTAVGSSWMKTSIAFTAYHLVTVVLLGQKTKGRFNDTTSQTQHQVQCRF